MRLNPLNSDDMALCPLSLRRRLGLEDCSRLLIEFQKEKLGQIKSFALHPVINAVRTVDRLVSVKENARYDQDLYDRIHLHRYECLPQNPRVRFS